MKLENAKRIVKAAEEMDMEVNLRETYSGRGMYGRTTSGVTGSFGEIVQAIAAAAADLAMEDDSGADVEAFIADMDISYDTMGKSDYIVY